MYLVFDLFQQGGPVASHPCTSRNDPGLPSVTFFEFQEKKMITDLCMLGTGYMLGPLLQSESMYIHLKQIHKYPILTWICAGWKEPGVA